ncbi:hypothetical protein ANN_02120 [Periplaneta americana]|uniref:Uncharacterized protein n=1 Tax=Periplaneta americana TaxID=6978 RepID=A0ABQ8TXV0_PERAM|nr:hypothetical protein ANN_02120 [Periplaneta americana]
MAGLCEDGNEPLGSLKAFAKVDESSVRYKQEIQGCLTSGDDQTRVSEDKEVFASRTRRNTTLSCGFSALQARVQMIDTTSCKLPPDRQMSRIAM